MELKDEVISLVCKGGGGAMVDPIRIENEMRRQSQKAELS